jgi:hypothetical protein
MKSLWVGALCLLLSSPLLAQTVDELRRQMAEKDAEIMELRERIRVLEREVTPVRVEHARAARSAADEIDEDSNRALERALVRERGLLLSPGAVELEPNFVYSHQNDGALGFRRDSFGPGLALRVGLPGRSQLELGLPYVVERRRDRTDTTRAEGIGDFNIGIAHQIVAESPSMPGLIGAISYQASAGRNTLFDNTTTPVALGSGFDSAQGTLTTIKRLDPLVLFGSYSFTHNVAATKNGTRIDPGNSHALRFGTALATGPETSLRAAFNLTFFDKTKFGDTTIPGSDDPMGLLELGGSVVLTRSTALDVLVGLGVTRNAPDFRITVALPIRF